MKNSNACIIIQFVYCAQFAHIIFFSLELWAASDECNRICSTFPGQLNCSLFKYSMHNAAAARRRQRHRNVCMHLFRIYRLRNVLLSIKYAKIHRRHVRVHIKASNGSKHGITACQNAHENSSPAEAMSHVNLIFTFKINKMNVMRSINGRRRDPWKSLHELV